MFDFSFSEIALIGVVALVVIGPERLPRVARTAGVVLGRVQRYAATVRADIAREVELSELRRVQTDIQDAARALEHGVRDSLASAEHQLEAGRQSLMTGPQAAFTEAGASTDPALPDSAAVSSLPEPTLANQAASPLHPATDPTSTASSSASSHASSDLSSPAASGPVSPGSSDPVLHPDRSLAVGPVHAPAPESVSPPVQAGLFAAHETPPGPSA